MRIPNHLHAAHPWLITGRLPELSLLDAWDLPVQGAREDFAGFVRIVSAFDPAQADSRATRALFALRFRLGRWLGWDSGPSAHAFRPLYQTDDEWVAEIHNATVHGALQLTWLPQDDGSYRGRLGVYVKPRGMLGALYLRAIEPFRVVIVYPALLRQLGRMWAQRTCDGRRLEERVEP